MSVWLPEAERRLRAMGRVKAPGCSRAGAHAHHIEYRSHGGADEDANLVSLCPTHHLHGVHRGFVRVDGRAPDGLTWWLGEEEVARSRSLA